MSDEKNDGNAIVKKSKTSWHRLLARLLEIVLSPVDIDVQPNVDVMTNPPEADILLLRRNTPKWTAAQRARLPDGIRDSEASDILIEFKYTQSFNEQAVAQAAGYDFFYKQAKQLPPQQVQTVLLSAREPRSDTLTYLGYQLTDYPGVYRSQTPVIRNVLLLSLNELSNEPHNLWIKSFASQIKVKKQVFNLMDQLGLVSISQELTWFIDGLMTLWFETMRGEKDMTMKLTPEQVIDLGKEVGNIWLARLTLRERLAGLKPEEVLPHFKPVDRLAGLKPEEVLPHFKPVDRLAGLEPEIIEEYLKQLKKQKH